MADSSLESATDKIFVDAKYLTKQGLAVTIRRAEGVDLP